MSLSEKRSGGRTVGVSLMGKKCIGRGRKDPSWKKLTITPSRGRGAGGAMAPHFLVRINFFASEDTEP